MLHQSTSKSTYSMLPILTRNTQLFELVTCKTSPSFNARGAAMKSGSCYIKSMKKERVDRVENKKCGIICMLAYETCTMLWRSEWYVRTIARMALYMAMRPAGLRHSPRPSDLVWHEHGPARYTRPCLGDHSSLWHSPGMTQF